MQGLLSAKETTAITWLRWLFPAYVSKPFAARHERLWAWVWALRLGVKPPAYVAIWPRGGGKTTTAELATVAALALKKRKYIVYLRRTQDAADKNVSNIANLLESNRLDLPYPFLGRRMTGKYGNSKGWRRERLRTSDGSTIDAMGLDSAVRGAKADEQRPDLFVLDDLDDKHDSPKLAKKNIETLTTSVLPAGSDDAAVLGIQNLIIGHGIFAQLVGNGADFLANRIVDGPHPALTNFHYEQRLDETTGRLRAFITGGEPTWDGQDLTVCQNNIDTWGLLSFRQEAQHEVNLVEGGMYKDMLFQRVDRDKVPALTQIECWVDPAISDGEESDCQGIQIDGRDIRGNLYRLWSWEGVTSPQEAMSTAIRHAVRLGARALGVETDQGGQTWVSVYNEAWRLLVERGELPADAVKPTFKWAKAGSVGGKVERQSLMRTAYDQGKIFHVIGTHQILEGALKRFPIRKPFDLADAAFWGWYSLCHRQGWAQGAEEE